MGNSQYTFSFVYARLDENCFQIIFSHKGETAIRTNYAYTSCASCCFLIITRLTNILYYCPLYEQWNAVLIYRGSHYRNLTFKSQLLLFCYMNKEIT